MSICLAFVFASLAEVGIVNAMSRKTEESRMEKSPSVIHASVSSSIDKQSTDGDIEMKVNEDEHDGKMELPKRVDGIGKNSAQRFDESCRKVFPFAFLLFIVGYWAFYMIVF